MKLSAAGFCLSQCDVLSSSGSTEIPADLVAVCVRRVRRAWKSEPTKLGYDWIAGGEKTRVKPKW